MRFGEFFRKGIRYLGLVGFCLLVVYVGPDTIVEALKGAEPIHVLLALILNFPLVALKALRWRLLMQAAGIHVGPWTALRTYFASLFIGFLTPGRVGEFVKAAYVSSKTQAKLSKTLPSAVMDRLLDLYVLTAIGIPGVVRYGLVPDREGLWWLVAMVVLFLVPLLLVATGKTLKRLKDSEPVLRLREKLPEPIVEAVVQMASLTVEVSLTCVGITILAYLVFFLQCEIGAWAVHLHISFVDMILVMSVTSLVSLIPVSVAGIGVRDLSLIVLLGKIGASNAQALAFSMMILIVSFIGGGVIGACCWLWEPIDIPASSKS